MHFRSKTVLGVTLFLEFVLKLKRIADITKLCPTVKVIFLLKCY